MGRIRLEHVKPNQLSKLRDLNQKLFPILSIAETSDDFYKLFTDETTGFAFIAYYSDMIAGAVCCELSDNNSLYIRLIGTLSRHRRKGVGKALLSRVFKEAETRDLHNIYTFVRVDNKESHHYFVLHSKSNIWWFIIWDIQNISKCLILLFFVCRLDLLWEENLVWWPKVQVNKISLWLWWRRFCTDLRGEKWSTDRFKNGKTMNVFTISVL